MSGKYLAALCDTTRAVNRQADNRILRRFIPKGSSLSRVKLSTVKQIEEWINRYPRRILGFKTAEEMFIQEVAA